MTTLCYNKKRADGVLKHAADPDQSAFFGGIMATPIISGERLFHCCSCKRDLPASMFYVNRSRYSGLTSRCKSADCQRRPRYRPYVSCPASREKSKRWQRNNKIKCAAYRAVYQAIQSGRLIRKPCEVCGSIDSQGHHDDYSKPLEVRWLCQAHHKVLHRGTKS